MLSAFITLLNAVALAMVLYSAYKKYFASPKNQSATWQEINDLANELGLTLIDQNGDEYNGGWMHGTYQNVNVHVQDHATRSGEHLSISTLFEVFLSQQHVIDGLEVFREELFSKISKAFGAEDIQIGHEDFDQAFMVRATSQHDAQRLFASPDVRSTFLYLQGICSEFRFKDGILTLEFPGSIFEQQGQIRSRIEALVLCARAIMNHKEHTPQPLPQPATRSFAPDPQVEPVPLEDTTIHW